MITWTTAEQIWEWRFSGLERRWQRVLTDGEKRLLRAMFVGNPPVFRGGRRDCQIGPLGIAQPVQPWT